MKKILLTGSNGFVGSNLAEYLHEKYWIVGMGRNNKIKGAVQEYIKADISEDLLKLSNLLEKCECIIHAAADKSGDDYTDSLIDINCKGTYHIAKLARRINCQKVIYISSIPVIGIPPKSEIKEEYLPFPMTMYHATKLAGEYILQQLMKDGIKVIILRIPSPIGKRMVNNTIFPVFLQKALLNEPIEILGKGSRKQNYIDLRDVANIVNRSIELDVESGCYNIASDENISNLELAQKCVTYLDSSSKIILSNKPDKFEGQTWNISIEKAQKYMNYVPKYNLEQMIKYYGKGMKDELSRINRE